MADNYKILKPFQRIGKISLLTFACDPVLLCIPAQAFGRSHQKDINLGTDLAIHFLPWTDVRTFSFIDLQSQGENHTSFLGLPKWKTTWYSGKSS